MSALRVELKVLDPRLHAWGMPRYHSAQAAAVDLRACLDEPIWLRPRSTPVLIPAGFAVHINDPHVMALILPRSGLGHSWGVVLGNSAGVIDADYTGPVMLSAWNRQPPHGDSVPIEPGQRIAQMIFLPILRPVLEEVAEFSAPSARGSGGWGSTGEGM